MNKIKLLLVEDDTFYQRIVEEIIKVNFPEIVITGIVKDIKTAKEFIIKDDPQILVLDINLPDGTSFDLLQQIENKNYRVVFISAYSEYALESLKFSFVDFVFKPFDPNDLIVAVDDAIADLEEKFYDVKIETLTHNVNSKNGANKLVIQGKRSVKVVGIDDIVWASAVYNGSLFYFSDGTVFLSPLPLRRYESLLRTHSFIRCHPKVLVNIVHVKYMAEETNRLYFDKELYVNYEPRKTNLLKQLIKHASLSDVSSLHA